MLRSTNRIAWHYVLLLILIGLSSAPSAAATLIVSKDGTAEPVEVEPERTIGNRTEIASGLEGGESIIVSGISSLKPGKKVQVVTIGESGEWK